jgi:hypothetical protein
MPATPSSQALMTLPSPMLKLKGSCPGSWVLQNGTFMSRFLPNPDDTTRTHQHEI